MAALFGLIFLSFMVLTLTTTNFLGDWEERIVAWILVTAYALTYFAYHSSSGDWLAPQYTVLLVDVLALIGLAWIAARSKRFWPLVITAFHLIPVLIFGAKTLVPDLVPYAVGVTQGLWGWLQLAVVNWAVFEGRRRRAAETQMSNFLPN